MIQFSRFIKSLFMAVFFSVLSVGLSASTQDIDHLVMADSKGDRGMLAPYVHHRNGLGYLYTSYIFDTLLNQDDLGEPAPGLASKWSISTDGLVYDLIINADARWHDGHKFTAEDVVFTIEYMRKHPYTFTSTVNIASVKAVTARHVRIVLKSPNAGMVYNWLISTPILPKHIYANVERPEIFTDKPATIGSGPYKLASYDKAQGRYVLERHEHYHLGKAKYKKVMITKFSPYAAVQAIASHDVDLFNKIPLEQIAEAKKQGLTVFKYHSNHPSRLKFNHFGVFKDQTLRQALAYSIDRQALVDVVYPDGKGVVADTGWFQQGTKWYSEQNLPTYAYDKAHASKLFEQNGWARAEDGRWTINGEAIELRFVTTKSFKKLATALAEQLNQFGIGTNLRIMEKAALQEQFHQGLFDIAIVTTSTNGDPNSAIRRIFSKSPKSDLYPKDSKISQLLNQQAMAMSLEERQKSVRKFQMAYAEKLPSYILINPVWAVVHNSDVQPVFMETGTAFGIPMAIPKNILMP